MAKEPTDDVSARYIANLICGAERGDPEAAEEVLDLFRVAVDSRLIDGSTLEYRQLAEYMAHSIWKYSQGADIREAFGIARGVGQPKGTRKVDETSYAALMILLRRKLGSAAKAKDWILECETKRWSKPILSRRKLDDIYTSHALIRVQDDDLLVGMLSVAHRKLFKENFAMR